MHVETARRDEDAVEQLLPADAAVFVAAVADWRTADAAGEKIKKAAGEAPPALQMVENPDILAGVGHHRQRPYLVVGFAAETQDLIENAAAKLEKKGADFIVANDVSLKRRRRGVMGGDRNHVRIVSKAGVEEWPEMSKDEVAARLAALDRRAPEDNCGLKPRSAGCLLQSRLRERDPQGRHASDDAERHEGEEQPAGDDWPPPHGSTLPKSRWHWR